MESEIQQAKAAYNQALQNLEKISDEIHKLREDQKLNCYEVEPGFNNNKKKKLMKCLFAETADGARSTATTTAIEQKDISVLSK
jgi:hypothetical protein